MKQTRDKSCGKTDRQPGAWISRVYLLLALVMLVLTLKTCVPEVDAALTPGFPAPRGRRRPCRRSQP